MLQTPSLGLHDEYRSHFDIECRVIFLIWSFSNAPFSHLSVTRHYGLQWPYYPPLISFAHSAGLLRTGTMEVFFKYKGTIDYMKVAGFIFFLCIRKEKWQLICTCLRNKTEDEVTARRPWVNMINGGRFLGKWHGRSWKKEKRKTDIAVMIVSHSVYSFILLRSCGFKYQSMLILV